MHALFAHKSLQITFLPCIRLVRGGHGLRSLAHGDNTVRRHATYSPLEEERAEALQKAPPFPCIYPRFFAVAQPPARYPSRHHLRGCRKTDAPTKFCTQSANTPPVQLHARVAHAAKQNRIRGKEDKGGKMKKNLPSPTRRPDVDIRVNKMQAPPASGHIERGARRLPESETERRFPPCRPRDTLRDEAVR